MGDEVDLIQRAKRGDKQAVGELYNRHYDPIFNYIFHRVDTQAAAEDLSADVFIRMLENLDGYIPGKQPFLAWLYTIARHVVIDHYRDHAGDFLPVKEELVAGDRGVPAEIVEKHQSQACYTRALYHLTELQRRVIIHKFIDERSTQETAELMGKSERAVRSLQHRALLALQESLAREGCL